MDLEATLLKPMIVMPGADAQSKASPEDVSCATLDALRRSAVPHAFNVVHPCGFPLRVPCSIRYGLCMLQSSGFQPSQNAHAGH